MKKVILGVVIGVLGTAAWNHFRSATVTRPAPEDAAPDTQEPLADIPRDTASYSCDGRIYCSQMTSCEEAEYFLANCPGVKMDGEGDGVPCEGQWCGSH